MTMSPGAHCCYILAWIACCFSFCCFSSVALADEGQARMHFDQGVTASREQRWEAARQEFKAAFEASPRPIILLNLAAAESHTGRLVQAAESYRRFLATPVSVNLPNNGAERKTARELLQQLETQIPTAIFSFRGDFSEVAFNIDGQVMSNEALSQAVPLDPGEHELRGKQNDQDVLRTHFSLRESEHKTLLVTADDLKFVAPVASANVMHVQAAPAARAKPRSTWAWVGGGALVVAAALAWALTQRSDGSYEGNVPPGRVEIP